MHWPRERPFFAAHVRPGSEADHLCFVLGLSEVDKGTTYLLEETPIPKDLEVEALIVVDAGRFWGDPGDREGWFLELAGWLDLTYLFTVR